MQAIIVFAAVLVVGCNAQANWVAHSGIPVRIAEDNFTALCVVNSNVSESTAFQWVNGSNIAPKAGRYAIRVYSLANQSVQSLLTGNQSATNWTTLSTANSILAASAGVSGWAAMITISLIDKDEISGLLCANQSVLTMTAFPYVKMRDGMKFIKNIIQGDEHRLTCDAYGLPTPTSVGWYKDDEPLLTDERVRFAETNGTINATLIFSPVEFLDDGAYTCYTSNIYGSSENVTIILRVKDRWAALWPFLGIVAEVIVLCTVILLYERRQQAKLAEEDEKDDEEKDNTTLMNDTNTNANERDDHEVVVNGDDVRQRPIIKS